ncbi:hypothetical protein Vretifemale_5562 [Volvox reticuliferus]|uniref:Uncharacterized protein n=1 Tax=Volvox reticuliferus TaxID=1737510 RepID=A0A8J4C6Z9_9CHLO|nr:hypothetical protein Vretifemale_5562 [Volvox reticuliferus]
MLPGAALVPSRRCCTRSDLPARQVWDTQRWRQPDAGVKLTHRHGLTAAGAMAGPGAAGVELQWNDVVEYRLPQPVSGAQLGVGRVDQVESGQVTLAPLEEVRVSRD